MNNKLHITSKGQTTHQKSVRKSCLWSILFHKFCQWRIFLIVNKSCLRRILFHEKILFVWQFIQCVVWSADSLVLNLIRIQVLVFTTTRFVRNSNEENVKQAFQIDPREKIAQHKFNSKTVYTNHVRHHT